MSKKYLQHKTTRRAFFTGALAALAPVNSAVANALGALAGNEGHSLQARREDQVLNQLNEQDIFQFIPTAWQSSLKTGNQLSL